MNPTEHKLWDVYMVLNDLFLLCHNAGMDEFCREIEKVEYKLQVLITQQNIKSVLS